jgi:GDP-4-dehydro-6-deoxy-D-mannose reductase
MKVLIMGITGFAGTAMHNFLANTKGVDLYGTFRNSTKSNLNVFLKAKLLECDVNDLGSIERVLKEVLPDVIFHFASYVSVATSFKNPLPIFQTNIIGTANLLEAIKNIVPQAKILIPGSAEEYGIVQPDKMPIKEGYPLNPVNPYAVSKKFQEEMGIFYFKTYGLNIYFTRTFHCTGPGLPARFVCSDFAKQIVEIESGKINGIKVGNLEIKRDFLDIREVVNAYWIVVNKGKPGEIYNVCSGKSISIKEILNKLSGLSNKDILVETDVNKLRRLDINDFIGDNAKLRNIGWSSRYSIDDSLAILLEGWRNEIKKS